MLKLKRLVFIPLIWMSLLFIGCQREAADFDYSGQITGPDLGMCMCCGGGYFVDLDNDETLYKIYDLPRSFKIDLSKDTFPINILVSWKHKQKTCSPAKEMKVQKIRRMP